MENASESIILVFTLCESRKTQEIWSFSPSTATCIARQFGEGKETVLLFSCFTFEITFENYELARPTSPTSISINGIIGFSVSIQGAFLADQNFKTQSSAVIS